MGDTAPIPTPTPPTDSTASAAPAPASTPASVSKEQYDRAVGDARADAAAHRVAAKAAQEEKAAALAAAKAAQEEAEAKIKAANEQASVKIKAYEPRLIASELKLAAHQAGLIDLDLLALVKRDGIKIGEDGSITGIAEAINAFKESKPAYFKTAAAPEQKPPSGHAAPAPAKNPQPTNIKDLSKEDYAKRKAAMKLRLHSGK